MDHRRKTKAQLIDELNALTRRIEGMEEALLRNEARFRGRHTEEALRGSEQRERERAGELSALLDVVPMAVFIAHDPACVHITGNHAADALLRSSRGSEASLGASPATRPRHFKAFKDGQELRVDELPAQRAARGEHVRDFEFSLVFEDGMVRHVVGNGTQLLDAQGQPRGSVLVLTDITDRKRAEELIREREKDLRLVMNTVPALISYIARDFRYVRVNDVYERWFGLAPGDIEGRHVCDVLGEAAWEKVRSRLERAMSGEIVTYEEEMPYRTGGMRWISATLTPDRDDSGTVQGIVALVTDINERKRMEEALRTSEARLRMHIERMPIGCIAHDENNCFSQVNPAAERIFGYSEAELRGKHANLLVPESARPHVDGILHRLAEGDMTAHSVNENVTKDGRTIVCEWTNTPLRDPSGAFVGILSMVQDVTERKQAEETLRRSERLYHAIGESIDYGVWVCEPDGRNIYASESFLKLVGITQEQCSNFGWGDVLHPDDAEHTIAAWKECVRTGSTWDIEHRFRGVDGQWHPILARGVPVRDDQGRVMCWAGINLDISRLKSVEAALRQAHDELELRVQERTAQVREQSRILESFFKHTQTCLVFLDRDFNFLRVNKAYASVCGREISDFVGHNHFIDYPSEELKEKFQQVVDTKEPYTVYARPFVFPDHPDWGTTYWDLTVAPIVDESGETELLIFSLLDVTDRIRLREEAMRAARLAAIGELAAGVAHEINNPINTVINYAQLIAQRADRDAPQYRMAEEIRKEGWRIATIVKGLLSFARDTKGRKTPVAVRDVVSAALTLTGASILKEGIIVRLTGTDDLPMVLGNVQELQQVVMNIISNACYALHEKYPGTDDDKVLEIRGVAVLEGSGPAVRLIFRDHGTGIPSSVIRRVHEPFFTTKPGSVGTGLGLSISTKIVENHGGRLTIDSREGLYTEVTIELPASREEGGQGEQ